MSLNRKNAAVCVFISDNPSLHLRNIYIFLFFYNRGKVIRSHIFRILQLHLSHIFYS